jgi:hypothetical protein
MSEMMNYNVNEESPEKGGHNNPSVRLYAKISEKEEFHAFDPEKLDRNFKSAL